MCLICAHWCRVRLTARRMQPGVTVALATVWLAVAAGVVGAVTPRPLRLSHDQYSPASPSRDGVQQDQADWRVHDPAKDQPLDLWIGSQRSISAEDSPGLSGNAERNFPSKEPVKDVPLSKQNSLASSWQTWLLNIGGSEFAADKVDYGGMPETLPREVPLSEADDPFVADDTFQDQGPGSVEIYKLDLSKEKALLTATTPSAALPTRNKSKAPKKVDRVSSKTKTTEIKSTTSPKSLRRQSNFFEEQRTETPVNRDAFGVGGVPELQVGCEGLAAWSHKTKRSIETPGKEEANAPAELLDVSSMVVNLDHGPYEVEEDYEEIDELFRIRKMEQLAAQRSKLNRGDIDPVLNAHYLNDRWSDELPVRGDLGETATRSRTLREYSRKLSDGAGTGRHKEANAKRETVSTLDDNNKSRGRRLLWLAEANTEGFAGDERKRAKRRIDWGFGEDEGVVSSDELQTVNERRRQHEMRHHQDAGKRLREPDTEIDNIRQEYEQVLEQKRREEEERLRRMQQGGRRTPNGWQEERDEMRRRQYEEYRRRTDHVSVPRSDDEEARRRPDAGRTQEMARRRNEDEHRRQEEEERRRLQDEARRRQEQYRWQQEAQRRKEDEERRRENHSARNLSEDRKRLEEERQWSERQRQKDKRRQQDRDETPANLMRSGAHHQSGHPNELGQRDRHQERRMQEEERRREQKLKEYIARNRPISVNRMNINDEYRRQQEDELRVQDYVRRERPLNISKSDQSIGRELFDQRRLIEEARQRSRHPDPGAARRRGPWAPTNIDPRSSLEEARRREEARRLEEERRLARERQRHEAEERRKELARRWQEEEARRLQEERRKEATRREEEVRREQSRRYEEDRKRLEAARVQTERRRQETRPREHGWDGGRAVGATRQPEATRSSDQDPRLEEHRRIQDSRLIPSYLVRDDARRLAERQQERARLEAERRRQEEESRRQTDSWRQQEITRLHALPVSARIIVRPGSSTSSSSPSVISRGSFENEIEFAGINPSRHGVQATSFPAPPTSRPPALSPGPCVWAVVQCCSRNNNRLTNCFESMGCPGINWDANPCRSSIAEAARAEVMKFYAAAENP
ncbi:trichohyalin-like isoform X2 [Odontomachus brunneus]|uniref:trichohyalin-like isoform X2 n=1 Tax=Odontomachus brunneus TaxID=486640 RepID=UPI0013F1DB5E|nr:trichohyalin-like isoform X2 [Odontomachus brunneus]